MSLRVRVVADAAQIAGQVIREDRRSRVVGVACDDLVAQIAKQGTGLVHRLQLCPADPDGQWHWGLGAQGNSQPAGVAGRRVHELALGARHRRRRIQEQRRVHHRAGYRTIDAQPVPRIVVRLQRHPIALRFQAEQAAPGRRNANRAAAVGSQRQRSQPGGHRGGATATAATRGALEVPRVAGGPERQRLGVGKHHQLGHIGFADDDRAGGAQPAHHLRIRGHGRAVSAAAACRHLAGDVDIVLDRDRHAEQGQSLARVQAVLRHGGLVTRAVAQHHAVAAQLAVQARDPFQVDLEQLRCSDFTVGQHPCLLRRAGEGEFPSVHCGSIFFRGRLWGRATTREHRLLRCTTASSIC
jgi:hypothetical protein